MVRLGHLLLQAGQALPKPPLLAARVVSLALLLVLLLLQIVEALVLVFDGAPVRVCSRGLGGVPGADAGPGSGVWWLVLELRTGRCSSESGPGACSRGLGGVPGADACPGSGVWWPVLELRTGRCSLESGPGACSRGLGSVPGADAGPGSGV